MPLFDLPGDEIDRQHDCLIVARNTIVLPDG
jgi:hypothetical protein